MTTYRKSARLDGLDIRQHNQQVKGARPGRPYCGLLAAEQKPMVNPIIYGSTATGRVGIPIGCWVLRNSKRASMPTIDVSVKRISSYQKRSLDYALGMCERGSVLGDVRLDRCTWEM